MLFFSSKKFFLFLIREKSARCEIETRKLALDQEVEDSAADGIRGFLLNDSFGQRHRRRKNCKLIVGLVR